MTLPIYEKPEPWHEILAVLFAASNEGYDLLDLRFGPIGARALGLSKYDEIRELSKGSHSHDQLFKVVLSDGEIVKMQIIITQSGPSTVTLRDTDTGDQFNLRLQPPFNTVSVSK